MSELISKIPTGYILDTIIFLIMPVFPLVSKHSYKNIRREIYICNFIYLLLFFLLSIVLAFVVVCFTDFKNVEINIASNSVSSEDEFYYDVQKFINNPYFLFIYSVFTIFLTSIFLFTFFQNKNKKAAFKYLEENSEDNGFIQPIYEAAKHNRGLIIETVDSSIYKGMCLYLTLDRDSTSTEKYICFLVFEKLFFDKNKNEIFSIYKNYDLFDEIKNAKDGNLIIAYPNSSQQTYYKDAFSSIYFEIYKKHSVIFKLSNIKTISIF